MASHYKTMEDRVFGKLHDLPMMLPREELRSSTAAIAAMALSIAVAHVFILYALRRIEHARRERRSCGASGERADGRGRGHFRPTNDELDGESLNRISYQLVHLVVNLILGVLGIKCYYALTSQHPPLTVEERVSGLADDADVLFFGRAQIAYQLWSIPAGVLLVRESPAMLAHHVGVVLLASVSTFASNGFRYFAPFFYGVIEISSVPLAVMNTFKTNRRRGWTERMPRLYGATKLTFAAAFLTVRVYLWLPHMVEFWYLAVRMFALCESTLCAVVSVSVLSSSAFLTYLQLLWATKIVRGLLTMVGMGLGSRAKKTLSKEE